MTEPTIVDKASEELARHGAPVLDFKAPVVEVTVLEDRAHVVRRGVVELLGGMTRLRVTGVAPVLADKTLCATVVRVGQKLSDSSRERVNDVRVKRSRLVLDEDRPEQHRALAEELEQEGHKLERMHARLAQLRVHQQSLAAVAEVTMTDIGVDVSHGQANAESWRVQLEQIAAEEEGIRQRRVELELEVGEQDRRVARLRRRMGETAQVSDAAAAEVLVEVWSSAAGQYHVQVDYIVPGACWRPYHRAQLVELVAGQEPVLHFASEGCVWQNTGEEWSDVQLIFSTERPSLGMEPPVLVGEVLHAQRRSEVLVVEAREQEVQTTGLGSTKQRSAELPGIDDGGEPLKLRSTARASVAADGRPHRVPLMAFTSPTGLGYILMPELAEAVVLKSTHVNRSQLPILAGPVDLVREGGFVGRSSLLFIAPGENFAIGWGPDGAVRVRRSVEVSKEDRGALSSWTNQSHHVTVRLSNLGPQERAIDVTERVPVSEVEKLRIEVDAAGTSEKRRPDSDGFVRWQVVLPGFGRRTVELKYMVRRHADIVGL